MNKRIGQRKILAMALGIFGILGFFFHSMFGEVIYSVLSPVFKVASGKSFETSEIRLSREEREELLRLREKSHLYEELSREYVIGTSTREANVFKSVAILARPLSSPYGTVLIGAGERDGIKEGNIVGFTEDIVYGYISKVRETSSIVTPFSNSGEKIDGLVEGKTPIELVGRGNGSFEFSTALQDSVHVGDIVQSRSGLLLGEVKHVSIRKDTTLTHALVRSPLSISSYRFLKVLRLDL